MTTAAADSREDVSKAKSLFPDAAEPAGRVHMVAGARLCASVRLEPDKNEQKHLKATTICYRHAMSVDNY